jgi:dUTP pyrophosphatase
MKSPMSVAYYGNPKSTTTAKDLKIMSTEVKVRMAAGAEDLVPRKAHEGDAAFDVRSNADSVIKPYEVQLISTGVFLELPSGFEAQIRPRSGLAAKHSLTILNSPGTIDSGYRGEVCVIMFNASSSEYKVHRGDRIAQMVIQRLPEVELVLCDTLNDSTRGANGFGSTGKR